MVKPANFRIVLSGPAIIFLQDLGPWDKHLTITNDAERVVEQVLPYLKGRRLFYYDSGGDLTELLIKDGKFSGFGNGRLNEPTPH